MQYGMVPLKTRQAGCAVKEPRTSRAGVQFEASLERYGICMYRDSVPAFFGLGLGQLLSR